MLVIFGKILKKIFALTNDSRKYKIRTDLYEVKQHSSSINECYTNMITLWEDLDNMNLLTAITNPIE